MKLWHFKLAFAVLAVQIFLFYFFYFDISPESRPIDIGKELFAKASQLAVINYLLWLAFDWYFWKILAKSKFLNEHLIQRVDLDGYWCGEMHRQWGDEESSFPIKVKIVQKFSRIEFYSWIYRKDADIKKAMTSSTNYLRFSKLFVEGMDLNLYVIYQNRFNRVNPQEYSIDHEGAFLITIDNFLTHTNINKLNGQYWTNKNRLANKKLANITDDSLPLINKDIGTGGVFKLTRMTANDELPTSTHPNPYRGIT